MKNKPSLYGGTYFRSKSEAILAASWDERGTEWTYEPRRLRAWLPDFEIKLGDESLLVEFKPSEPSPAYLKWWKNQVQGDYRCVLLIGAGLWTGSQCAVRMSFPADFSVNHRILNFLVDQGAIDQARGRVTESTAAESVDILAGAIVGDYSHPPLPTPTDERSDLA